LIKINLVREGRAVRAAGGTSPIAAASAGGPAKLNNILVISLTLVGLLLASGYWFMYNRRLAERKETVRLRKVEADKLESIIRDVENYQKRKESLQNRINLINELKQNQKGPVRIMDQISKDLPDLVWLDTMSIASGSISVTGRGLNPNAVANFVENIKNDPYFEEPSLENLTQTGTAPLIYSFTMSFGFSYSPRTPGAPGVTDTTGTAGTTTGGASGNQSR
jgi:type IV pilus assembly protein PilN